MPISFRPSALCLCCFRTFSIQHLAFSLSLHALVAERLLAGQEKSPGPARKRLLFLTVWPKNDPVNITILIWFIAFAIQTVILFGLVWTLIKFQKLDQHEEYHFLKVLAVAALASGLNLIPYFGRYLSALALLLGIKTVTRSPYTDVLFTVVISYALMFLVNLFIIGALMGELRPSPSGAGNPGQMEGASQEPAGETEAGAAARTNPPGSNPASQVSAKPSLASPDHFAIKGITRNGAKSVVIIDTGVKTYSLFLGDAVNMETADGNKGVRFDNLDADWVTLNIDGKPVKLPAH